MLHETQENLFKTESAFIYSVLENTSEFEFCNMTHSFQYKYPQTWGKRFEINLITVSLNKKNDYYYLFYLNIDNKKYFYKDILSYENSNKLYNLAQIEDKKIQKKILDELLISIKIDLDNQSFHNFLEIE